MLKHVIPSPRDTFPKYWQDKANEPVAPNAIRVVALGDSAMQAIGAAHPEEGIAGRGGVGNSAGGFCQGIQQRGTPPGHLLVAIATLEQ